VTERVVQRRLAAIVSADVVAYTRLMERDEVGTHARLRARFKALVDPKIGEHGGRVVRQGGGAERRGARRTTDRVQDWR
jgi:class 3 adenylate cyclase